MRITAIITIMIVSLLFMYVQVYADASLPHKDVKGAADIDFLGRYQGSYIVAFQKKGFDRFILPTGKLKAFPKERDSHNNILFKPEKSMTIMGQHTRLVYLLPEGVTPLEIVYDYRDKIKEEGGQILYECENAECGGDPHRSCSGGGGDMSLSMFFQHEEDVTAYNELFSNGYCALTSRITGQEYLAARLPERNAYVSILAYTLGNEGYCNAFKNRTIAVVDVAVEKKRAKKIVVIKAAEMEKAIGQKGSIALYGIYFDTDKATIKEDSRPELDQIGAMLRKNPALKLLVVGHTDDQGSFDYNMKLSMQRAIAVVHDLEKHYGIAPGRLRAVGVGYSCPAASNRTEQGRARNRRVALVEDH